MITIDYINRFITEFNKLHKAMNDKAKTDFNSFGKLLEHMKPFDKNVQHYYAQLEAIRELRNLLVHEKISTEFDLATPTQRTIDTMRHIRETIETPGTVGDFFSKEVWTLHVNDPLSKLLARVKESEYTQFPVFSKEGLIGVLSHNGVTRWLAREFRDDVVELRETVIGDLVEKNDIKDYSFNHYKVVHPNTSLYQIEDIFMNELKKGKNLFVLLISKESEITKPYEITGMVTSSDIPQLIRKM